MTYDPSILTVGAIISGNYIVVTVHKTSFIASTLYSVKEIVSNSLTKL